MAAAIIAERLSKSYRLSGPRAGSLRDAVTQKARRWFGMEAEGEDREFWALRDVSFSLNQGERLGIIGRNGAGKSTLLKILARITEPTGGSATIRGRMASLLEVGTGFHPELTGRENIYLNGAILGMGRSDVARRFDEIVAFADTARFLDVPVKRYSSGMHMRLAFAVAAHLEPEILVVDEVLAVGDADFQRKCLGRMETLAGQGRTVVFVSHNLAAVANLCTSAILLEGGQVRASGEVAAVIRDSIGRAAAIDLAGRTDRQGNAAIRFTALTCEDGTGRAVPRPSCGQDVSLCLRVVNATGGPLSGLQIAVGVDNCMGARVAHLGSEPSGGALPDLPAGEAICRIRIPRFPLMPGSYRLTLFAAVGGVVADWLQEAATIDVEGGDFYGTGRLIPPGQGDILIEHSVTVAMGGG
jgi:lipopolysaccharide transport system ATP-binding protein